MGILSRPRYFEDGAANVGVHTRVQGSRRVSPESTGSMRVEGGLVDVGTGCQPVFVVKVVYMGFFLVYVVIC